MQFIKFMLSQKIIRPVQKLLDSIPFASFSGKTSAQTGMFRVDEIKKSIREQQDIESKNMRELLKNRDDYLQEANVSFYELEISIDLYYQHNTYQSMYVKSLFDFSNVSFVGVSL